MARVIRTPLARKDLKEIGRYIARESQSRSMAIRFLDSIRLDTWKALCTPRMVQDEVIVGSF